MINTQPVQFTDWRDALVGIGLREAHVSEDVISVLTAHGLYPDHFNDDTFMGYFSGESEIQVGAEIAKDWAELGIAQEFIVDHIDWFAAWKTLEALARLILIKVSNEDWILIAK